MLGIGAIIVAVWFYVSVRNAVRANLWPWVAASVAVYYVSAAVWIHGLLKWILGSSFYAHDMGMQLSIKASGIIVGLLVCALMRWRFISNAKN